MSEELKPEMTKDQIEFGVDEKGFWKFVSHEEKGLQFTLGFLEQMKDIVKAHYFNKLQAAAESKKLVKPPNGFRPKWH